MRINTRELIKGEDSYFVVTRRGRRIEDKNYKIKADAEYRANCLYTTLKEWDPKDINHIAVTHTSRPYKVY